MSRIVLISAASKHGVGQEKYFNFHLLNPRRTQDSVMETPRGATRENGTNNCLSMLSGLYLLRVRKTLPRLGVLQLQQNFGHNYDMPYHAAATFYRLGICAALPQVARRTDHCGICEPRSHTSVELSCRSELARKFNRKMVLAMNGDD